MKHNKLFIIFLFLFFIIPPGFCEENDSLVYEKLKSKISNLDSSNLALKTADALAKDKLYKEAIEILRENYFITDTTINFEKKEIKKTPVWFLSSGVDYYRIEDIDTFAMTPEELKEYKKLTQTPISLWLRIKSEANTDLDIIKKIALEHYISEYKSRFETNSIFKGFKDILTLDAIIKAEKWFKEDASISSVFKPFTAQPSDMVGTNLRLTAGNSSIMQKIVEYNIPVSINWEHYRLDRPGYESVIEYSIMPVIIILPTKIPLQARFSAQAQYEDYYSKMSDSLDVLRLLSRAEISSRFSKLKILFSAIYFKDCYTNSYYLENFDRTESFLRLEYYLREYLKTKIQFKGIYQTEIFSPSLELERFKSKGYNIYIEPAIEAIIKDKILLSPQLKCEKRFADIKNDRFIWHGYNAIETELRIGYNLKQIEILVKPLFRLEDVESLFERYILDSRMFSINTETNIYISKKISANLFAEYQYRIYYPYNKNSRVTENINISLSLLAKI